MADGEVRAQDLSQETSSTLSGNEQFVMFDSVEGKRADIDVIADYIVEHGEINGNTISALLTTINNNIGTLSNLNTTTKTNLVAAINEVLTNEGALSSLSTTVKTSLVAAINELISNEGALSSLSTTAKNNLVAAINEVKGETTDLKEDFDAISMTYDSTNKKIVFTY